MSDSRDDARLAQEFALKWFEIHAAQRLHLMQFYFAASGFLIAGYLAAFQAAYQVAALGLSLILVALSWCFWKLDQLG